MKKIILVLVFCFMSTMAWAGAGWDYDLWNKLGDLEEGKAVQEMICAGFGNGFTAGQVYANIPAFNPGGQELRSLLDTIYEFPKYRNFTVQEILVVMLTMRSAEDLFMRLDRQIK